MAKVMVFAGTTNGMYMFESDARRAKWKRRGPYMKGGSVNHFAYDPKSKTLYAATLDQGVMMSKTRGRSWNTLNDGLPIRKVWAVAVHPKDSTELWAGTHFSYLFRSKDRGRTWSLLDGYMNAPGKEARWGDWGYGTIGNSLHGIHFDPLDPKRMIIVSSTNHGAVRTADGGETWEYARTGVFESCPTAAQSDLGIPPDEKTAKDYREHLDQVHACTHRIGVVASAPNVVYRQLHCGVYRSDDFGSTWRDISAGLPDRHGFPLAVHAKDPQTAFVVPAYQGKCDKHNSCIIGALDVYRTRTGGRSWEKLSAGLPRDAHCVVLRHGMDVDTLHTPGVYFGTSSGDVYASPDGGDRWMRLASKLPRVQGITAIVA